MPRRHRILSRLGLAGCTAFLVSLPLLLLTRLSLAFAGFGRTSRTLERLSRRPSAPRQPDVQRIASAVELAASRRGVRARCLPRSLVLWFLLRRRGVDAQLVIGALPPDEGVLQAHAWVEVEDMPVNDVPDVRDRYGSFGLRLPRLADGADT